ncbi:hypothetical protein [Xenorhabdus sp. PB62.4]|uniref:hypothetical protein n=1 Tax=Xenorhabdus sp. PB62.4 TaxID=1851573 RepID=UPI0016572687|nr:hypothetical protein [Xenorhabdus sp. PB62.4]MBC8954444.1 hypothetical protein [Xenorhabdus sp. PB62.4]
MFQYGKADALTDNLVYKDGKYQLSTRAGGLIQAAGGAVEIIGGAVSCGTGIGCAVGAVMATQGIDNLYIGSNILESGKPIKTMGAQGLEALGVPPEYSEITYAAIGLGGSVTTVLTSPKTGKTVTVLVDKGSRITRSFSEGKNAPHVTVDSKSPIGTKIDKSVVVTNREFLPDGVVKTFRDRKYETVITQEPITVFRKFGGTDKQAKLDGGYATTERNVGRNDTAVYKKWSTSRFEAEIEIPQDTKLNIGIVGKQPPSSDTPKYRGGGDQILLPRDYPMDWVKSIRDGKTGKVYTYEEFKVAFPDQVTNKR